MDDIQQLEQQIQEFLETCDNYGKDEFCGTERMMAYWVLSSFMEYVRSKPTDVGAPQMRNKT